MSLRPLWLRFLDVATFQFNRHFLFRRSAQRGHILVMSWLRRLDASASAVAIAKVLHRTSFQQTQLRIGGVNFSQRLILAAGLLKGEGFANEDQASSELEDPYSNIIPGWRIVPALMGPVEFGSFTRKPRIGNEGTLFWRLEDTLSTQNYVGLRNPGAYAAARFLGDRRDKLPVKYGINIAPSPRVSDIDQHEREIVESLTLFLDAGLSPAWFTLNLSCPNTEDDPQNYQLEAETRQLCSAFVERLRSRKLDIPLWVKLSPGLAPEQYYALMRVFDQVGVQAVVATNTISKPKPGDISANAGVGGGALFDDALAAICHLRMAKKRINCTVDLIGCGGILNGETFAEYRSVGVEAAQYWSALVYRGPFAAAIIESELATNESKYEAVQRESLA